MSERFEKMSWLSFPKKFTMFVAVSSEGFHPTSRIYGDM